MGEILTLLLNVPCIFLVLYPGCTFLHCVSHFTRYWRNRISWFRVDGCTAGGLIEAQVEIEPMSFFFNQHSGHSYCSRVCFNVTATAVIWMNHTSSFSRTVNHTLSLCVCGHMATPTEKQNTVEFPVITL